MADSSAVPDHPPLSQGSYEGALSAQQAALGLERCPWCGQPISREKFLEIEARIREEERKRLAAMEATIKKEFTDKETGIRKKALEEAEQKLKIARAEDDRRYREELKKSRELLAQERDRAILKQQGEFNRRLEASQKKAKELERQLQQKTAHEMGDGAEIDLLEDLREAFPEDRITRIMKGQRGADILHEVIHNGKVCGRIVIDSKNRQSWQNQFVAKLREDQIEAEADHAILATTVFPAGKRELHVEDGVIVANPARVRQIVELLRIAAVRIHLLGLSGTERADKMTQLYGFMTSEKYAQLSGEASKLSDDILEVDVSEQQEHQRVWKKRGGLVKRMKNVLSRIDTEISAIVGGGE